MSYFHKTVEEIFAEMMTKYFYHGQEDVIRAGVVKIGGSQDFEVSYCIREVLGREYLLYED